MCGIHGFINGNNRAVNADDFIRQSYVTNMLRGMDSSGIASIDADTGNVLVHKLPVNGMYFQQDKVASDLIRSANQKRHMTFCHVRAATQGSISMPNAHPFQAFNVDPETNTYTREIVGIHNGTLNGWKNKKDGGKYDVDSEWAINRILAQGLDAFKEFAGAYAFVWWDSDDWLTLNIARNDQRTLYVAFTEGGGMAFASEAGQLVWMLERNKMKIEGDVRELTPGFLYKFDVEKPKEFTKEELPKYATPANVSTAGSPDYNRSTYTRTWNNTVEKVAALLDKVKGRDKTVASPTTPVTALLPAPADTTDAKELAEGIQKQLNNFQMTREEIDNASIMGVQGLRGMFLPRYEDNTDRKLYGTITLSGSMEFDAVMRNVSGLEWKMDEEFDVSVLGMIDDGQEMCCIVSKPRLSLVPTEKETATIN